MARLDYPKHVYKGEGDERTSIVVTSAADEAAKAEQGYAALPSAPEPPGAEVAAIDAQGAFLEYPKHLYRGEGEARESRIVTDAEAEAAACEDGFALVGVPADGEVHDVIGAPVAPVADTTKAKKAPKTPKA